MTTVYIVDEVPSKAESSKGGIYAGGDELFMTRQAAQEWIDYHKSQALDDYFPEHRIYEMRLFDTGSEAIDDYEKTEVERYETLRETDGYIDI